MFRSSISVATPPGGARQSFFYFLLQFFARTPQSSFDRALRQRPLVR
jgi:hypothetical protein